MNHWLSGTITSVVLLLSLSSFAETERDPQISDIDVRIDDIYIKKVEGTKIGALFASQLEESDNPTCRAAAVLVSQEAVDKYGYWSTFVDLLKETVQGVKLGADLAGAKSVSKVAQLAGTIVECFEQEEPEAALGRAIVTETTDWVSGKIPKTDQKLVDDAIKRQADKAKTKLTETLFPGKNRKANTYHVTVGDCAVDVTPEFQWPGPGKIGGIRLFVSGDCQCKKPLKFNSGLFPTTFHGQPDDIKNSQLGRFFLIAFLPMERMETSVSYGGKAIDLAKYLKTGSKLKTAIENALAGKENKESPDEIAKDLQEQTGKITNLKATLFLKPVFSPQVKLEEFKVLDCGNCPGAKAPGTAPQAPAVSETSQPPKTPQNVEAEVCDARCLDLWKAWHKAVDEFLEKKKLAKPPEEIPNKEITAKRNELNTLKARLEDAEKKLAAQKPQLEKDITEYEQRAQSLVGDYRKEVEKMVQRLQEGLRNLEWKVAVQKSAVDRATQELATLEKKAGAGDAELRDLEQKADTAMAAYYECARCCWEEARAAKPDTKVPNNVLEWGKEHPIDGRLVGRWRSEPVVLSLGPYQSGGAGIIMTIKDDGVITMDYNGMEPLKHSIPATTTMWSGTAIGKIKTCKNEAWLVSVEKSELTHKTTVTGGKSESNPLKSTGPAGIAETEKHVPYTVDETTLKYTHGPYSYTFKRQERETLQPTTTGTGK